LSQGNSKWRDVSKTGIRKISKKISLFFEIKVNAETDQLGKIISSNTVGNAFERFAIIN
jgi:ribonuclease P protein component